jgi:hypothetical protein
VKQLPLTKAIYFAVTFYIYLLNAFLHKPTNPMQTKKEKNQGYQEATAAKLSTSTVEEN